MIVPSPSRSKATKAVLNFSKSSNADEMLRQRRRAESRIQTVPCWVGGRRSRELRVLQRALRRRAA